MRKALQSVFITTGWIVYYTLVIFSYDFSKLWRLLDALNLLFELFNISNKLYLEASRLEGMTALWLVTVIANYKNQNEKYMGY